MNEYKLLSRKGEGTFSEVLKAQSLKTGHLVAIKCMKTHFNSVEQVNQLREIQALKKLSLHNHIVQMLDVLYDEPTGRLALVFELMEMNMYELIKGIEAQIMLTKDRKTYLNLNKIKNYMYQVFKAIDHMHKKGIFHRDIKPENILLSGEAVKLADFGSCRGMFSEHPYTEYISTRWYRPPECLMTDGYYDYKMDIWGAGCVMFEIITLVPLFPGNNELDMIHRIHNILGTPHPKVLERFKKHATHMEFNFPTRAGTGIEKLLPNVSRECLDLLKLLLTYDPEERITSDQVLKHEYFKDLWEADKQKEFQNSLTSMKLTPTAKAIPQLQEEKNNLSNLYSDIEKSPYHPQNNKKKTLKKSYKSNPSITKYSSVNLNLQIEGIMKPNHFADTSTEDELDKGNTLPPLKSSVIQINPPSYPMKKKDEGKKYLNTSILKPSLSGQHLFKKSKKNLMMYQTPEYVIYGKKAN